MEADVYPLRQPELSDLIDGAIGELSPVEDRVGDYAQGVGPETAILPQGWEDRLIKVQNQQTDLKIGYCLEPHDLAASKLAAGRDKDWDFVSIMLQHGLADKKTLQDRIGKLPISDERQARLNRWIAQYS
jgi:hypothetical protein